VKVLVTGALGQVAQSMMAAGSPHQVIAVGRPDLDIAKIETVHRQIAATKPDVVVNAAAYTAVDKAESEPDAAWAVNRDGADNIARATAEAGLPVVQISTDYVYSGTKAGLYVENDETVPMGVYGRSKLAGEEAVAAANPHHLILRTAWVFSPYGHNFAKTMLRLAETRPELGVVDDQHGSPTYAPHLADAILAIVSAIEQRSRDAIAWGVYNLAGAGETTWCGLAREIFARSAAAGGPSAYVKAITTADYPTPARRPANSRLDCSKSKAAFGVELPHWTSGVGECVTALLAARQTT